MGTHQIKNYDLIYEGSLRNKVNRCFRVDLCCHLANACKTKEH